MATLQFVLIVIAMMMSVIPDLVFAVSKYHTIMDITIIPLIMIIIVVIFYRYYSSSSVSQY